MTPRLSEDARYRLAAEASTRQRRNRPRLWVALAAIVLAGAMLFLMVQARSRGRAASALRAQTISRANIELMLQQLKELQQQPQNPGGDPTEPMANLPVRMEEIATASGLASKPRPPITPAPEDKAGGVIRSYRYSDVQDPSLSALLAWVQNAEQQIPGLHVHSLVLTPSDTAWKMTVSFKRWERKS